MNSDETLWEGMLRGDKDMFLSLYKKYYHVLLFIGLKAVKDTALVKDTIHQLFLYLWEKRETIHAANNVKSYLVISFLRKLSAAAEKSGRMSALQAAHNNYTEDTPPTPEERLIKKDEQDHLSRMIMNRINDLPDHQKKLIFLRFYEGLSYGDIVQLTGLSQRTVYNKIHEALKKLRLDIANSRHSQSAFLVLMTFLSSFTRTI